MKKIFVLICLSLILVNCGLIDKFKEGVDSSINEQSLCSAVEADSISAFSDNDFSSGFNQLNNDQTVLLKRPSFIDANYDGKGVIALKQAIIDFDYEDDTVDPGNLGGFNSRWKIVILPYTDEINNTINQALDSNLGEQNLMINQLVNYSEAAVTQLSGPFLSNGCEWGDTDEIGTQTLNYSNYGIYDWDYFNGVDRVIGFIYEGDDGIHDDLIAKLDFSRDDGEVSITDDKGNTILLVSYTHTQMK